ncbi:MAG: right-handed parallel beta-helix repeat-containing protein, partial [Endomicrobiales bacterium]|nr:right-handed parallel beta-helix repeat-containing protein [Endomicrobiales bacterium]
MIEKSGIIKHDEVWDGKILITGDFKVPEGVTLRLMPGCEVSFAPKAGYRYAVRQKHLDMQGSMGMGSKPDDDACLFVVSGRLITGKKGQKKIRIGNEGWNGLFVIAQFEQDAVIENCIIHNAYCGLGKFHGRHMVVRHNQFVNNTIGLTFYMDIDVHDNVFSNCGTAIAGFDKGAAKIHNNKIRNSRDAIRLYCQSADLLGNALTTSATGVELDLSGFVSMKGNRVYSGNNAVKVKGITEAKIEGNKIESLQDGISCDENAQAA